VPTTLRIAVLATLLALASNLAVIGYVHFRTLNDATATLREQSQEQAAVMGDVYKSGGRPAVERAIRDTLNAGDPQAVAALLDARGRPSAGNVVELVGAKPPAAGYRILPVRLRDGAPAHEAGVVLRSLGNDGWLLSGRIAGDSLAFQRTLENSLVVATVLALLLGLVCGGILARYVGRRVQDIAADADRISAGDLDHRIALSGSGDAFDDLGRQINHMLDRIGTLMNELRMLTDSLAHDLRSPVSRLRAQADAASSTENPQERDALLAGVMREADALMRIVSTVLEIGRSEAMTSRNQFAWLDPAALTAELAEMYEPLAEEAGAALTLDRGVALLPLLGHRQLLAQALSNLLENAVHYASAGGEIVLFVRQHEDRVRLGVADRGPGIPIADQAEAKRRFGRLDSSRSTAGAGLGLALVEAIAHAHNGALELSDNAPGLIAALSLPVRRGAPPAAEMTKL
jgi:signal transduction histidine kinase